MHGKPPLRAGICVAIALLGFLVAGCDRGYRQIAVVNEDKVEIVTWGRAPRRQPKEIWVPGRTLVFRTSSTVPGTTHQASGKAGHVYRINDDLEMEEVGEFQLSMPNDTLAYQFGK